MTEKHKSEKDLFEDDLPEDSPTTPKTSRRVSVGPKLPIMSPSNPSTPSSPEQGTSVKQTTGQHLKSRSVSGASIIGSTLGDGTKLEGVNLKIVRNNAEVVLNVWTDVLKGAKAADMNKFIEAVSKNKTFNAESFIEGISYQGFNREFYIQNCLRSISISMFIRFAILGAIRGSNFLKIQDTCLDMPTDMISLYNSGVIVKKAKKRTDMTILRFTASVPQWCCYWMLTSNIEKKIQSEECPGWLQFPGAASLPMSEEYRRQHLRFSIAFSKLLPGGKFNENIYYTAYANMIPLSEVPESLRLKLCVSNQREAKALSVEDLSRIVESSRLH